MHYCTFQSSCCAVVQKSGPAIFSCFIARERKISRRWLLHIYWLRCVNGRCSTGFELSKKCLCMLEWLARFWQTFRNTFQWNKNRDLPAPNQVSYFPKQVGPEFYIQGRTKHLKQDTEVSWEQNCDCPRSMQHHALQLPHPLLKHFINGKMVSKGQTWQWDILSILWDWSLSITGHIRHFPICTSSSQVNGFWTISFCISTLIALKKAQV